MKYVKLKLATIYPIHVTNYGIGDAALNITENMNTDFLSATLYCPASSKTVLSKHKKDLFPSIFKYLYYKLLPARIQRSLADTLFLWRTKSADIIYIWPGISLTLTKKIKKRGQILIGENINCHQKTAREIIDREYERLSIKNSHKIEDKDLKIENELLALIDFVFSPSPQVTSSLKNEGVPKCKILTSSYGLKIEQRIVVNRIKNGNRPFTAIFVGRVGVRKGTHLLLDYWKTADIDGKLKIVGAIDPEFHQISDEYRDCPSIEFIDFTSDLESIYAEADLFIMPSLEEGSPLVTYLAIGAGLPCLTSPMGGEGIIRNDIEGYVLPPYDKENWIKSLRKIATSAQLSKNLSAASYERSENFLWAKVGKRRADLLLDKLKERIE